MNNNSYLQKIIDDYIKQQLKYDQMGYDSSLGSFANKMNSYGSKLSSAANILNKISANSGDGLSNIGSGMQNIGSTISDIQNIPGNFAKNLAGQGLQSVGNSLVNKGVNNAISNGLVNYGSQMAGSTAGTIGGNLASGLTGTSTGSALGAGAGAGTATGGATAAGLGTFAAPIGALVGAAITGANRNRAKDMANSQLAQTDQLAKAMIDEQDNQLNKTMASTNNLMQQQNQQLGIQDGVVTGGASSLSETDPYQTLKDYQKYLTENGYDKDTVNGVAQGLNSGHSEIDEWLKQYAQGAEGKANGFKIPTSDEDIANARKLAQSGKSKNYDQNKLINKLAKGFADFQTGYQDNRNNGFKPENLIQYEGDNKGFMQRLGEGVGTTARLAQNPNVQGLVAGGLSMALTGNPMAGFVNGYKFARDKQSSDMYQDQLAKQGINVNTGATGRLDSKDFDALMTPSYRDAQIEVAKAKLANTEMYHKMWEKMKQQELNQKKDYQTKDLAIKQQNATTSRINATKKGSSKKTTPQDNPSWNSDFAEYAKRITDPRYATQAANMKAIFIKKHGVDPDKYLKL